MSIFASPYTDAFCAQAVYQILPNLPRAFERRRHRGADGDVERGDDRGTRLLECIRRSEPRTRARSGRAFRHRHGRANAIFLPHVLRYNAALPSKFMPAPGYTAYVAPEKYAQIAWIIGLGGRTEEERRERLFASRRGSAGLRRHAALARAAGVTRGDFEEALPELARAAFEDASIRTNPRIPLVHELTQLLEQGFLAVRPDATHHASDARAALPRPA